MFRPTKRIRVEFQLWYRV